MMLHNLKDNFDSNSLDTVKWGTYTPVGGFTVTNSGGKINCNTAASTVGEAQIYSQNTGNGGYSNMTFKESFIQGLVTVQAGTTTVDTAFKLLNDTYTVACYFVYSNTNLYASKTFNGVDSNITSIAYSSTNMAYWRIRESGGFIYYEYGPDGLGWTTLTTTTSGFMHPESGIRFLFTANEWGSDASATGASTLDSLNMAANYPAYISLDQGFK